MRRAPLTLALIALAVAATALPPLAEGLVADRARLADGEAWRLVTGPLVHLGASHLLWDLAILLVLGLAYEARLGRAYPPLLLAGLALPVLAELAHDPGLRAFYGVSALNHALMAAAVLVELERARRGPALAAAAFLLGKLAWGLFGTGPLTGPDVPEGVRYTPFAHLAGALAGLIVVTASGRQRLRQLVQEP